MMGQFLLIQSTQAAILLASSKPLTVRECTSILRLTRSTYQTARAISSAQPRWVFMARRASRPQPTLIATAIRFLSTSRIGAGATPWVARSTILFLINCLRPGSKLITCLGSTWVAPPHLPTNCVGPTWEMCLGSRCRWRTREIGNAAAQLRNGHQLYS